MDRVGLEVESNGLRLQEVGRSLEELAAFKAEAAGSLDMIKRELTETAEVMKQEMEQVLATSFATVTEDVVALRQRSCCCCCWLFVVQSLKRQSYEMLYLCILLSHGSRPSGLGIF